MGQVRYLLAALSAYFFALWLFLLPSVLGCYETFGASTIGDADLKRQEILS